MKYILAGIAFAMLWSSASVATKIGLKTGEPFIISNIRFFIAGILMLFLAKILRGSLTGGKESRLPNRSEFIPLAIYGFLNVTVYLGAFVLGMREVSAGIGSLSVAINPLIISVLSAVFLKGKISINVWLGLILGISGVAVATYPLLIQSHATLRGLGILGFSMLSYSVGTLYYSSRTWSLPLLIINGWQVFFGGIFLLPITFLFSDFDRHQYDPTFWKTVLWLAIPVSIGAVQLWLYLLKIDTVKASLWLFLNPIFGFAFAKILTDEPITAYTWCGTGLVILGLFLGQKK